LKQLEYSQIVRRKLKNLKIELTEEYGAERSKKIIGEMTKTVRRLEEFSDSGVDISQMYDVDTDYFYVFTHHNYFIYRTEGDKVIIIQMFNEKEDFMMKLFGISGRTQESIDYWGE
jgi:plasmid stabilization system protein ParE